MIVIQKIRRELFKPLSRLCVKSAIVNYFGLNIVCGFNRLNLRNLWWIGVMLPKEKVFT